MAPASNLRRTYHPSLVTRMGNTHSNRVPFRFAPLRRASSVQAGASPERVAHSMLALRFTIGCAEHKAAEQSLISLRP
jgi:hypothetical protein